MGCSDLTITARIHDLVDGGKVKFIAACPPDYRQSFTGSGLPFTSPQQAFHETPNIGEVRVMDDGKVVIRLQYPNAYYEDVGRGKLVPPTLFLEYKRNGKRVRKQIKVGNKMPYRDLIHPSIRQGATFYSGKNAQEVRSQEQILYDSGYPAINEEAIDFWGKKPPL
jgi:hypothetical protein